MPEVFGVVEIGESLRVRGLEIPTPASPSGSVPLFINQVNGNAGPLTIGTPVYTSANDTVDKALANAATTTAAIGLVGDPTIAPGATGTIVTDGMVAAATTAWDLITGGVGGLVARQRYWVDPTTAGMLTTVPPTTPTRFDTPIGRAYSTTEMLVGITQSVAIANSPNNGKLPIILDVGEFRQLASTDTIEFPGQVNADNGLHVINGTFSVEAVGTVQFLGPFSAIGTSRLRAAIMLEADITPPALTGIQVNGYGPSGLTTGSCSRQDVTAPTTITGMTSAGGADGMLFTIHNIATGTVNAITFTNEDAASSANQRFTLPNGASLILMPGDSQSFRYDATSTRWRPIAKGGLVAVPSTPARAFNTNFQPSLTNYVLVIYSIQFVTTSGQDSTVELRSDTATPPTTVRATVRNSVTLVGITSTSTGPIMYLVPPGHFVRLNQTGTGTVTLVSQTEIVLT